MWKHLRMAVLAAVVASPAQAGPWYAEAGYGGGSKGNLAVGYDFNPQLGVEVGLRRADDGQQIGLFGIGQLDPVDGYEVAVRSAIELSTRTSLTGRFGAYKWQGQSLSFDDDEQAITVGQEFGTSVVIGAGMRVRFNQHLQFTGEYIVSDAFFGNNRNGVATVGLRVEF